MKLNEDMLFAHPVVAPSSKDFNDATFETEFTVTLGEADQLDIAARIELRCPDLEAMIAKGDAGCGFFVICRPTYQNRLIEMGRGLKVHRLKTSDFFGTVVLRPVVWSKKDNLRWNSEFLHPEYEGIADFPGASILALGAEYRFSVDRERLKPFETIFSLAVADDLPPGRVAVDVETEKLTIRVHPQTKAAIEDIRNSTAGRDVLLNAVYLPALIQILAELARDPARLRNRSWFRVFEAKCSAAGISIENPDLLRDAQDLLALPFLKIEREKERLFS